jgi:hypothetical protein
VDLLVMSGDAVSAVNIVRYKNLYTLCYTWCNTVLSDVVSVRVPRELKEKMKRYPVDWSGEIRRFIEERIRALELLEVLKDVESKAERRRTRVDTTRLIREEREER